MDVATKRIMDDEINRLPPRDPTKPYCRQKEDFEYRATINTLIKLGYEREDAEWWASNTTGCVRCRIESITRRDK